MNAIIVVPAERTLFGHPVGLAYLGFTEAFERFSYYGMQGLLVLYMTAQLLHPEHAEAVLGLAGLRAAVESVTGPLSTQAFAAEIAGLYGGFVYVTPMLGGWIGDRFTGRTAAVTAGTGLMAAGHLLMVLEASFLIALVLLVTGAGLLKGNISAQVGAMYAEHDPRRGDAFSIFNVFISAGGFVGPLVCGALGEMVGWHYGFGAAGIIVLFALGIYLAGRRYLPPDPPRSARTSTTRAKLDAREWLIVAALLLLLVIQLPPAILDTQQYIILVIWARDHVERHLFGFEIPVNWLLSIGPLAIMALTPAVIALWRWQGRRQCEPSEMGKMAISGVIYAVAALVIAWAPMEAGKTHVAWAVAHLVLGAVGMLFVWPLVLALISRAAPARIASLMMGVAFFSIAVSSFLAGWLGQYYERVGNTNFWLMHTGLAILSAVLFAVLARPLNRVFSTATAPV
ncbi:MAG: peptide MFS transporter [Proteobacteria bacterium]|nr:peptide MFS transporter [Pseudomonadota bacterium]